MNKCGDCSRWLPGGDFGLCCKIDPGLHYESSDACEKFDPMECAICDEVGGVHLVKSPDVFRIEGKSIPYERWSYHCDKCGADYEAGWMFDQNVGRIAWERRIRGI